MTTLADELLANPYDHDNRIILADLLEEQEDPRAEWLRLVDYLTGDIGQPDRTQQEARLRQIVAGGVQSVGPYYTNSIGMQFVWIPPGVFLMGLPESEQNKHDDETQHTVMLSTGFFMGIHQITQKQWAEVMGNNPSHFRGDNRPVERVSWNDCQEFIKKLSEIDGPGYRLPTEAEWEYSCRAGTTSPFYYGDTLSTDLANYDGNYIYGNGVKGIYRQTTTPVGSFPPNAFGLHDMHGNVWEWCQDWYGAYEMMSQEKLEKVLRGGSWYNLPWLCRSGSRGDDGLGDQRNAIGSRLALDPVGSDEGEGKVVRGGSWYSHPGRCRSALRNNLEPGDRHYFIGARLALTV